MNRKRIVVCIAAASMLMGCAVASPKNGDASNSAGRSTEASVPLAPWVQEGQPRRPSYTGSLDQTVYFDFDSSRVDSRGRELLAKWIAHLRATPSVKVRLEGHTDERGTAAYNLGLAERRGQSVRDALLAGGVAAGQIELVSFGEEKPARAGHDEAAWALNRRVDIAD